MTDPPYDVLFLCTGNSARSLLAECALARHGAGRFRAHSAGSRPTGAPHPVTIRVLQELGFETAGLRSKSWDEFAAPGAPALDVVLTVCDSARGESCPVWPGRPATAHWGVPDPAAFEGDDAQAREVFLRTYRALEGRIRALVALPIESLDADALVARLREIGEMADDASA